MKKQIIIALIIFLAIFGIISFVVNKNNVAPGNIVGDDRDEHGCLTPAGYAFDDGVGACIRAFEMTSDIKRAAGIAVKKVGESYALTVVSFNSYEEPGAYDIMLERGLERELQTINIRNGVATIALNTGGQTFTQTKGSVSYSIDIPAGWYPFENGPSVIFTQNPDLIIPPSTDGFAIGPNFYISVGNIFDIAGVTTYDTWLEKNGMTEKSELFISKENVTVNGYSMVRVRNKASAVTGEVVSYVYFVDIQRVITLTQFPYDPSSDITKVFEKAVQTFRVSERQNTAINCLPEQRNIDVCTEDYTPVCATVEIQCIKAPCNPIQETFTNSCNACKNPLAKSYVSGECSNNGQ